VTIEAKKPDHAEYVGLLKSIFEFLLDSGSDQSTIRATVDPRFLRQSREIDKIINAASQRSLPPGASWMLGIEIVDTSMKMPSQEQFGCWVAPRALRRWSSWKTRTATLPCSRVT
jgi:hypothetical protein